MKILVTVIVLLSSTIAVAGEGADGCFCKSEKTGIVIGRFENSDWNSERGLQVDSQSPKRRSMNLANSGDLKVIRIGHNGNECQADRDKGFKLRVIAKNAKLDVSEFREPASDSCPNDKKGLASFARGLVKNQRLTINKVLEFKCWPEGLE